MFCFELDLTVPASVEAGIVSLSSRRTRRASVLEATTFGKLSALVEAVPELTALTLDPLTVEVAPWEPRPELALRRLGRVEASDDAQADKPAAAQPRQRQ